MPVVGNEETTVKPISRQFSNYIAGVPIKKRRFPLIQPSSPQSEEKSTSPKDGGSVHGEKDSNMSKCGVLTAHDLSVIENKSVPEGSTIESEASTDLVCNAGGFSRVEHEDIGIAIPPSYVDCFRHEENLVITDGPALRTFIEKTDLKVSPEKTIAENVGSDANKEKKAVGMLKSEVSTIPPHSLFSLDFQQHSLPVLAAQRKNEDCHNRDDSEQEFAPSSSSMKNSFEHCEPLQSNRANWDLNTTTDSWEDSECEAPAMKLPVPELTSTTYKPLTCPRGKTQTCITCEAPAMKLPVTETSTTYKPLICPSGITQTGITSHRQDLLNSEFGTDLVASQRPSEQLNDSLRLCFSSSFSTHFSHNSCKSSATILDSGSYNSNLRSPKMVEKLFIPDTVVGAVKSEPFEESVKIDCESDDVTVNLQLGERCKLELSRICKTIMEENLINATLIKSESVEECNMDMHKILKGISSGLEKKVIRDNVLNTSVLLRTRDLLLGGSSSKTCSAVLSVCADVLNAEHSMHTDEFHLSSDISHLSKDDDAIKQEVMDQDTVTAANENTGDTAVLRIKLIDEHPHNFHGSDDGFVSDDEKINIFTDILEEDSYGSDYESDVNQAAPVAVEVEDDVDDDDHDDDYEDGEVREPVASSEVEGPAWHGKEKEDVGKFKSDDKKMNLGSLSGQDLNLFYVDKVNVTGDPGESINSDCKDYNVSVALKSAGAENEEFPLLEPMVVEEKIAGADVKRPTEANQRRLDQYDQSSRKETLIGKETSADQAPDLVSVVTVIHSAVEDVKNVDLIQKIELASVIVEASFNSDDVAKDACGGSSSGMSRIINLPRGSSSSLPGKTRSFSGRSFPLPPVRERIADMTLDRRKLNPRGRDEFRNDGSQNFSRKRNHDRSPRYSRTNFLQDRRKFNHREDTLHGDWDCEGDFSPSEYHVSSQKYVSVLHHIPSRGRSPGVRDGFASSGLQMVRGMNRNICASRHGGEDGSDMAGERHNEKFIRGFRDDRIDSVFTHAQPPFEGVDGKFGRRNRNFSSIQRDLFGVHSKSPMRSRSCSPGPWLLPRRSPDMFGHTELTHPRSTMYRVETMRSPDRSCFRGEMAVRRHGSPSFVSPSNNIIDVGSGRDNGHLQSVVPDGSRSNRRFDVMDHRERADNDEYFDRFDHSARFEFNEDGNGVERRRFRSFRSTSGRDDDNFHVNAEDSSRPFRYFPGDDVEFRERGSLRERDFGRRVKNRPGNLPRQMRSMDELGERDFGRRVKNRPGNLHRQMRSMDELGDNYRLCGQVWRDDSFGDRTRRKRF